MNGIFLKVSCEHKSVEIQDLHFIVFLKHNHFEAGMSTLFLLSY